MHFLGLICNMLVLCMKSVTVFGIVTKREGGSRFTSGALGQDPTGNTMGNSAAGATTNLRSMFLVDLQQISLMHKKGDKFWHWLKKGGWEKV